MLRQPWTVNNWRGVILQAVNLRLLAVAFHGGRVPPVQNMAVKIGLVCHMRVSGDPCRSIALVVVEQRVTGEIAEGVPGDPMARGLLAGCARIKHYTVI